MATGGDPGSSTRGEECDVQVLASVEGPSRICDPNNLKCDELSERGDERLTASDFFAARMSGMISEQELQKMLIYQSKSLSSFEKTNEKFKRFNDLSASKYESVHQHFKTHTKVLIDMKKDLETVFRRIRTLKSKLNKAYPTAFMATSENIKKLEEEFGASDEQDDSKTAEALEPVGTQGKRETTDRNDVLSSQVYRKTTGPSQTENQQRRPSESSELQATGITKRALGERGSHIQAAEQQRAPEK